MEMTGAITSHPSADQFRYPHGGWEGFQGDSGFRPGRESDPILSQSFWPGEVRCQPLFKEQGNKFQL